MSLPSTNLNLPNSAKSTCCYCGVGCGIVATRDAHGMISVIGDPDHPVNRGQLCSKGRTLHHVVNERKDRILRARVRDNRDTPMNEVDTFDAIWEVAGRMRKIIDKHGPDAVAMYVSGQCLTEEYYLANKLMKGFIGTNNIDTNSRLCMSSAVAGYKMALGDDIVPVCYEDIDLCDCFFVTGANPAWCHPILWRRVEARMKANPDTKLIVVDPRRTDSCAQADLHLQILPEQDITLHNAIAAQLIAWDLIDHDFVAAHCDGFESLRDHLQDFDLAAAAAQCGVPYQDLEQAARWIAESPTMMTMWTMGLNQSKIGTDKNTSLLNLSLLTGQIGKPGSGPFSLTGQPNAMGGREVGGMATLLAAHLDPSSPQDRQRVADYWDVDQLSDRPGLTALEMVDAMERGSLKAVWIVCTNPAVSFPNLARFEAAMAKTELVVVQDISERSDTLRFADIVLPAAGWLEKRGTMTNCERRVTKLDPLLEPPGDAWPDVEIFCQFAANMGWETSFSYRDESEIYDEYATMTSGTPVDVSGLNYERLDVESVQWPCPEPDHLGTARLLTDHHFYTANRRARLFPVQGPETAPGSPDFPFVLTTGRVRDQWHTRTKTGKVTKLNAQFPSPFIEIHPADAESLGLIDGATVEVTSPDGSAHAPCKITDRIRRGVLFMPMHWGRGLNGDAGRANNVTSSRVDPISKQPDFKFTAVRLRPVVSPSKTVIVVGAGAAALQFIQTYREHNVEDEIVLFGREPRCFYNRILLPDLVNGERSWEDLVTLPTEKLLAHDVDFRCGVEITGIDRLAKTVQFEGGAAAYDKLVLCTGSRPFVPPGIPTETPGIYTLRTREDAEEIRRRLAPNSCVLIVGGGLLGIEMATALNHIGVETVIVERAPRLMERQLDDIGSEMLANELERRGIPIHCGEECSIFLSDESVTGVVTDKGRHLYADVIIVAVGTRPNIEFVQDSGIAANRGLLVDGHLLTSDPDVYALGEIAEFEGQLFGITKAAQEQAEIAARHCAGNPWAIYKGSVLFNILKIHGRPLASAGLASAPDDDPAYEEIAFLDRRKGLYQKCVLHRGRMVGCIFIGDTTRFPAYRDLIQSGVELDERRDTLLREGGDTPDSPIGPIVCSCNQVGEGNILQAILKGHTKLSDLCRATRAGTGCGSCRPELQLLLERQIPEAAATLTV